MVKNPGLACGMLRRLEQPAMRLPLPSHLSHTLSRASFLDNNDITNIFTKAGFDPGAIKTLTLAYPHKHPGTKHYNAAEPTVSYVKAALSQRWPAMSVIIAEGLFEEEHLDRSGNQSALHALRGRQHYSFDIGAQREPLPFVLRAPTPDDPDPVILVDDFVEQGTTAVDWTSFLHHNGATVVAIVAGTDPCRLAQDNPVTPSRIALSPPFNTGTIPVLAEEFVTVARREGMACTPDSVTALLEHTLNRHGRSLTTLTNTESYRLRNETRHLGVTRFLTLAGCGPAEQAAFLAAHATPAP